MINNTVVHLISNLVYVPYTYFSLASLNRECTRVLPGGSLRGERANFTRLVLGCIEAKFTK